MFPWREPAVSGRLSVQFTIYHNQGIVQSILPCLVTYWSSWPDSNVMFSTESWATHTQAMN